MNFCKLLYYIFMPIFFIDKDVEDREITIEKGDLFHHFNNVLRVHKGEEIRLFSKKFVYEVVVKEKLPDKILLQVMENFAPDFPLPEIFLVQSIIERNSLEEVLRLNIPIFVRNFILFGAKRSNFIITEKNLSRFQKIALSVDLTEINPISTNVFDENLDSLSEFITRITSANEKLFEQNEELKKVNGDIILNDNNLNKTIEDMGGVCPVCEQKIPHIHS